jgi:hypothetical protein
VNEEAINDAMVDVLTCKPMPDERKDAIIAAFERFHGEERAIELVNEWGERGKWLREHILDTLLTATQERP